MIDRQRFTARKCGRQPSRTFLRLLKLRHPTLRLMWAHKQKRWAICEVDKGDYRLLCLVAGPGGRYEEPGVGTIQTLDRMHPRNLRTKWQIERFLKGLDTDAEKMQYDIQKRARERAAEGSKDLFNVLNKRLVVSKHMPAFRGR